MVDGAAVARHIAGMVVRRRLTADEAELIDRGQLEWFVGTALAGRLRALARAAAGASGSDLPLFGGTPGGAGAGAGGEEKAAGVVGVWGGAQLLRELPFVYALPLAAAAALGVLDAADAQGGEADRGDWPQLRGTIDVLAIEPGLGGAAGLGAEIVDYKTDAATLVEAHLPAYRRQMLLYARAVEAGLGVPVVRATLVFLAARDCRVIDRPAEMR